MTTNNEILAAYTREFDGHGHDPADHARQLDIAMDFAAEMAHPPRWPADIDEAHDALARSAQKFDIPADEYFGALAHIAANTAQDIGDADFEIHRVLNTFHQLTAQPVTA